MSFISVLVVEDFEPFRRFICSTLGKRPELRIVGEISDELEAVQKAQELQPGFILLDSRAANAERNRSSAADPQARSRIQNTLRESRTLSRSG